MPFPLRCWGWYNGATALCRVHIFSPTACLGALAEWARAGEKRQLRNLGAETLKLATVFVPGYTAEENYNRSLDAARRVAGKSAQ